MFRQEEAAHQEAPERLHVVHEGDEGEGGCGVYAEGERGHQPNTRQAGESWLHLYQSTKTGSFFSELVVEF